VPALRNVPDAYLAEPWTMPDDVQARSGCRIGEDYPEPIVDHAQARREALDRYRV
jgi:deoxyribodipyrimidine photolyase